MWAEKGDTCVGCCEARDGQRDSMVGAGRGGMRSWAVDMTAGDDGGVPGGTRGTANTAGPAESWPYVGCMAVLAGTMRRCKAKRDKRAVAR